ncbi:DNA helicase, partial [Tanacetum coccineum]
YDVGEDVVFKRQCIQRSDFRTLHCTTHVQTDPNRQAVVISYPMPILQSSLLIFVIAIRPPSTYAYLGTDIRYCCQHCGLRFWYQERVKNIPSNAYPEYIKLLLADRHFLENIRAYNQMFSMTSLDMKLAGCSRLASAEEKRLTMTTTITTRKNLDEADKEKVAAFAKWLLDIGDGCTGKPDDTDPENTSWVDIPPAYSIPNDEHGISNLIKFIYDDDTLQFPTAETLQQKAIVCPENETADMINSRVLSMLPGTTRTYKSFDEATPLGHDGGEVELLYPTKYLNTLSFAGLPSHNLELKVGTPIMLLRNINIVGGLCNGTRMIVKQLLPKVIEAQIITGTRVSQKVYLPRIPNNWKDPNENYF